MFLFLRKECILNAFLPLNTEGIAVGLLHMNCWSFPHHIHKASVLVEDTWSFIYLDLYIFKDFLHPVNWEPMSNVNTHLGCSVHIISTRQQWVVVTAHVPNPIFKAYALPCWMRWYKSLQQSTRGLALLPSFIEIPVYKVNLKSRCHKNSSFISPTRSQGKDGIWNNDLKVESRPSYWRALKNPSYKHLKPEVETGHPGNELSKLLSSS